MRRRLVEEDYHRRAARTDLSGAPNARQRIDEAESVRENLNPLIEVII